jgi:hypothetical protein
MASLVSDRIACLGGWWLRCSLQYCKPAKSSPLTTTNEMPEGLKSESKPQITMQRHWSDLPSVAPAQ